MSFLSRPTVIKNIALANRLVMPPMAQSCAQNGVVTQKLIDYYNEKSSGGHIGLIITEHSYVSKEGMADAHQVSVSRDDDVEGLKHMTEAIHANKTKVIAQISHAGSSAHPEVTGTKPISASAIANMGATGRSGIVPEEMSLVEIKAMIQKFADASRRVKEAGFDGVEIHSAHSYLLNQFYSPLTNQRKDEYGGSLEKRIRLHLEIIDAIRGSVGDDYLVALRLGACDYMDGGTTIEDSIYAAKAFEKAGVDLLDISGGLCGMMRPNHKEAGYYSELSEAIKKEVSIPTILTGGITDANDAEKLLRAEKADLIGVGRSILKDSEWAKRAMQQA